MVSDTGRTNFFLPPAHMPDTIGENNTPTALKGCGVKMNFIALLMGWKSWLVHSQTKPIDHGFIAVVFLMNIFF